MSLALCEYYNVLTILLLIFSSISGTILKHDVISFFSVLFISLLGGGLTDLLIYLFSYVSIAF